MVRFTIAVSNELNTWLEEQARLRLRSKNKQIEYLLDTAMQNQLMDVARLDFHHIVDEETRQGWIDGRRQGEK